MQPGSERTPIWSDDEEIPIKDHELKLAIPIENVFIVDSEEKLIDCFNYLKKNVVSDDSSKRHKKNERYYNKNKSTNGNILPIGLNIRWVSDLSKVNGKNLALIQLAVNDRVFLIDAEHFIVNNMQPLEKFMKKFLKSKRFMILGLNLSKVKECLVEYFEKEEVWSSETNLFDFSKFRNLERFIKICGADTSVRSHTGHKLVGLNKICHQVNLFCLFEIVLVIILTYVEAF